MAFDLGAIYSKLRIDITEFLQGLGKAARESESFKSSFNAMGETAKSSMAGATRAAEGTTQQTTRLGGTARLVTVALNQMGITGVNSLVSMAVSAGKAAVAIAAVFLVVRGALTGLQRGVQLLSNDLVILQDRASKAWEETLKAGAGGYFSGIKRLTEAITKDLQQHGIIWLTTVGTMRAVSSILIGIIDASLAVKDVFTAVQESARGWAESLRDALASATGIRLTLGQMPWPTGKLPIPEGVEAPTGRSRAEIQRDLAAAERASALQEQLGAARLETEQARLNVGVLAAKTRGDEAEAAKLQAAADQRMIVMRRGIIGETLAGLAKQRDELKALGTLTAEVNAAEQAGVTAKLAALNATEQTLQAELARLPILGKEAALQAELAELALKRARLSADLQIADIGRQKEQITGQTLGEALRLRMSVSRLQVQQLGLRAERESRVLGELEILGDERQLNLTTNLLANDRYRAEIALQRQQAAFDAHLITKEELAVAQELYALEVQRVGEAEKLIPLARQELAERLKLVQGAEAIAATRELASSLEQAAKGFISELTKGVVNIKGLLEDVSQAFIQRAIGQSLSKLIDSLVEKLEKGLSGLFGQSGALWMGVIGIAVAGIASFFKDTSAQVESLGDQMKDNIQDVERTRGLIAGETTIAIAQLSENLKMAFRPTNDILVRMERYLQQMAGQGGIAMVGPGNGGISITTEMIAASR